MTEYKYSPICNKYPMTLEVELIRGCNIWPPCPMCSLTSVTGYNGHRPMKIFDIQILEQNKDLLENAHHIFFCGYGEPLLSKSFFYYLDNFDPKTPFSFFSNGQLLDREKVERMINHNIVDIGFSIDAGTEETYRKIRGHGDFTLKRTLDNIEYLVKRVEEHKKKTIIMLLFVIMKENYQELPQFMENGIRIGIKHFKTWHMRKRSHENDYREHVRNGFYFNYLEQSILENRELYEEFKIVREQCYEIADRNNVTFETEYTRDNEFFS